VTPELSVSHLTDQQEIESRLKHPAAHRARMAHRVIRLRETGFEGDLGNLAKFGEENPRPRSGSKIDASVHGGVARLIHTTLDGADSDREGPTDSKYAAKLFGLNRSELFAEWKQYADESAEAFDADGFAEAQKSEARDLEAFDATPQYAEQASDQPQDQRARFKPHGSTSEWAANALYDLGREGFLAGEIDADTAVLKVDLVDTGAYTIDLATHKFRSSIAAGARIASSAALGSKTVAAGVFDAADITYTSLSGTSIELIVIYQSSAVGGGADVADTAQRLIAAIDTATGLPFTPSGGDVSVTWDNTTNRIFKL
jgi:hypothetical protein